MGLDMYAYAVSPTDIVASTPEMILKDDAAQDELMYWRKHAYLHGWMEKLYRERGGKESFNGVAIQLTLTDLEVLEKDIKESKLPETHGFFFGNYPPDEETMREDLKFVEEARQAIAAGRVVLYNSSW
jgi:hypothetical protein